MAQRNTVEDVKREKRAIDLFGERMKGYEKAASLKACIDRDEIMIVRLDGHKFSKFTKGFMKPFDERLKRAMEKTTIDLVKKFDCCFGYTQSDEITLVWPPIAENQTFCFGGRITKIASVLAGYCSVRFDFHINKEEWTEEKLASRMALHEQHFDGRCFGVPRKEEALNNIIWRCLYDCRRNSVSGLAHAVLGSKRCHGLNTKQQMEACLKEGHDWNKMPDAYRFGIFVKKEIYIKEVVDHKDKNKTVKATRSRLLSKSFDLGGFTEENVDLVFRKYWNPDDKPVED